MPFKFQKPVTRLLPMTSKWHLNKQLFIFFINYHEIFVLLKYFQGLHLPPAHQIHLPGRRRTSTHSTQRTELSRFHHQKISNLQICQIQTQWTVSAMLEAYRKLKAKPKTSAELKEVLQVICGNLPQRLIDKAVKDFSKRLKVKDKATLLELMVDTSNIHSCNGILASDHS